jgi:tetratricopeptide (TPR) repeat protein/tRNA A-37 threonylcarbamoyl transferase component Bud32
LLQLLGEGGMGSVYVAEQSEPVKRRVALKVVKPGMDSAQVLRRFEAERQALALMDHPHIARVFDAGTSDGGRPYFVMELVPGVPITRYCDELHLPIRGRLELFVPVCQAIQHAHQKGIIHRDIKPSNVLVCMPDGKPVPKVIDFGVAKALHQRLTDETVYTEIGAVVGTLEYMSPEQAEMSPLGVDTRTDVYALGVLLYELLTGTTPLDRKRLHSAGLAERLRIIKEEEPPQPSTRLSESKQTLASLAARRGTQPGRLRKEMRGEPDWIVMKCLEKDRSRRYESAGALARDVERYLHDEPVEACPPARGYRLRKFLRRNKGLVSAALFVLVALLVGTGGTTWGMVRAERERDEKGKALDAERQARARTREILDELSSSVIEDWLSRLQYQSPEQKAFLEKTAKFYEEYAAATGEDESTLAGVANAHLRLAKVYQTLGRSEAPAAAGQAAALFRQLARRDSPGAPYRTGLMLALNQQTKSLLMNRKSEELDPFELEAIRIAEQLVAEAPNEPAALGHLARMLIDRGNHLTYTARPAEALAVLDRAQPLQDRLITAEPGNGHHLEELARIRNYRMDCLYALGRDNEADRDRVAALELYERIARRPSSLASARKKAGNMRLNTGVVYGARGRFADAGAEYRKAEDWFGPLVADYPGVPEYRHDLAVVHVCWARALAAAADWPAAADKATRALQAWKELGYWSAAASALTVLADCQFEAGKLDDAVRDCTTAIQWLQEFVATSGYSSWTRQDLAAAHASRARALDRLHRYTEALADWDKAIEFGPELARDPSAGKVGPPSPAVDATHVTSSPYNLLVGKAGSLTQAGRVAEAESTLRHYLAVCGRAAPDAWTTFHARSLLGGALLGQRKYSDAEPLLVQGYEGMKARQAKVPPEGKARLAEALARLIQLYDAWDKKDEAAKWRKELGAIKER